MDKETEAAGAAVAGNKDHSRRKYESCAPDFMSFMRCSTRRENTKFYYFQEFLKVRYRLGVGRAHDDAGGRLERSLFTHPLSPPSSAIISVFANENTGRARHAHTASATQPMMRFLFIQMNVLSL